MKSDQGNFFRAMDGTEIWYQVIEGPANDGLPPLVLCDGIGCAGYIWRYLLKRYKGERTLVQWHYRGHGNSQTPSNLSRLSLQHLTGDLRNILREVGISNVVLMGHSMGVQIILEFYRQHPEVVAGLVPICGSYGRPADTFHGTDRLRAGFDAVIKLSKTAPGLFSKIWHALLPTQLSLIVTGMVEVNRTRICDAHIRPYLKHLGEMNPEVFFRMLEFAIEHTTEDLLHRIDVPTLIVAGTHDGFTPADCSTFMHAEIPDSELLVLQSGTHTAPLEFPVRLEERIEKFLLKNFGNTALSEVTQDQI